ncbi:FimV/HubP family polar landmark protein, partial [Vibrio fujianensis]|uniref:FimV/HubP family polar landmark protein n=1 Tax=Vibrio fujianensis TaxID=1974215 RepID=UPI002481D774
TPEETTSDQTTADQTTESEIAESELAEQAAEPDAEVEPESEPLVLDDRELPEYSEADALADSELETESDVIFDGEGQPDLDQLMSQFDENGLNQSDDTLSPQESPIEDKPDRANIENDAQPRSALEEIDFSELASDKFSEQQLDALLDEGIEQADERFNGPLDTQTIDSAGMDIDAMLQMGGEDWNGFNLTEDQKATIPDEVPAEDQAIWQPDIQNQQPEVEVENWGHQEDIVDFDPEKSEFMTIDELMAQVEREEGTLNPDDEELKLEVGLDEFPDVIGDVSDFDVDSNAEAAGKLDLAKIYMEMNDRKGAIKLLEEAIVDGSDDIRRQAKHLIDVINGRG